MTDYLPEDRELDLLTLAETIRRLEELDPFFEPAISARRAFRHSPR